MNGRLVGGVAGVMFLGLAACGGPDTSAPQASGGGAAATQGGAANQAGAVSQGGNGTPTGGAAAAGAGQGGASAPDCTGTFGAPELALPGEAGITLGSPTLSPDGLELIYARKPREQIEFRRSVRTSSQAAFPIGAPLPSLDAACQAGEDRSVDLSRDGLRAYVACYSATVEPVGPATLHVAQRTAIGQDFTLLPGTSMIGPSAAIAADELTLYSASDIDPGQGPSRQFTRSAVGDAFGKAMDIPGLEMVNVTAPEPSPDGLSVYGGLKGNLVVSARPSLDMPFAMPTTLVMPATTSIQLGAPEMSHDCRSLYYLSQADAAGMITSEVMVLRR